MPKPIPHEMLVGLCYNADTGELSRSGRAVGCLTSCGKYWRVYWKGCAYLAHRVIWTLMHGGEPVNQVDHINRDGLDNRLINLREASQGQNQHNRPVFSSSSTGIKGVSYCPSKGKYLASVALAGKRKQRWFQTGPEAALWVQSVREQLHGEFCKH